MTTTYQLKVDWSTKSTLRFDVRQVDLDEQRVCIHQLDDSIFKHKINIVVNNIDQPVSHSNATHRDIYVSILVLFLRVESR